MVGLQEPRGRVAESDEDEDDQPEEVTLASGREEAEGRRKAEQASRKRVAAEAKQKRRKWSEKAKEAPQSEPSPPEIVDSSGLLQEDVIRYLAAREQRSRAAEAEPSEQETQAPQVIDKKKRKTSEKLDDQSNRLQVVLLNQDLGKGVAQSAKDFRHERLFGSHVRRSVGMLSKTR